MYKPFHVHNTPHTYTTLHITSHDMLCTQCKACHVVLQHIAIFVAAFCSSRAQPGQRAAFIWVPPRYGRFCPFATRYVRVCHPVILCVRTGADFRLRHSPRSLPGFLCQQALRARPSPHARLLLPTNFISIRRARGRTQCCEPRTRRIGPAVLPRRCLGHHGLLPPRCTIGPRNRRRSRRCPRRCAAACTLPAS